MKWKLTFNQYQAVLVVIRTLLKGIERSESSPLIVLYNKIITETLVKVETKHLEMKHYQKKEGVLKLTEIQAITFYVLMSEVLNNGRMPDNTSLECIMSKEICRDIHQKLLTK